MQPPALLFAPFAVSMLGMCLFERVMHVFLQLFSGTKKRSKNGIEAKNVVGSAVNFLFSLLSMTINIFFRWLYAVSTLALGFFIFFCVGALWYVIYEDHPEVLFRFVDFYNARLGPFVHGYMLLPLDLFNLVFKGIIPVYNGIIWVLRTLSLKGFLPILWAEVGTLMDVGVVMINFGRHASESLLGFYKGLGCSNLECLERPSVLDVLTPMADVRNLAVLSSRLISNVCYPIGVPVEILLYLFTDLHFAKGLHGLVNSGIHLVLHVPRATLKRCVAHGKSSGSFDVLLCTPDMEPVFSHMVSGIRGIGIAVDNWLGFSSATARRSVTGVTEDCTRRALKPDDFRGGLLTGAQTVIGLTEWLTAVSNGTVAYFFGQVTSEVAPRLWPEAIDVGMGIAAVQYSEGLTDGVSGVLRGMAPSSRMTTSLLGCKCVDTQAGLSVGCQILSMSGEADRLSVVFQDSTWSSKMTCASVEIHVKSVRWPVRRYEGRDVPFGSGSTELPELDCVSKGTCESLDATIWLVPRCDTLAPQQCSDTAVGTSCFPFCMAARISGSGSASPVFLNAERWRSGKQLLRRDCALADPRAEIRGQMDSNSATSITLAVTTLSGAARGAALFVRGGDGASCTPRGNVVSWVPMNESTTAKGGVPAYVRRKGQPFAISGDAVLLEFEQGDGVSLVEVDRLTGNQRDEYSLVSGWSKLPSAPNRMVSIQEIESAFRDRLVIPWNYVSTRVLATGSRDYVFYAVSPDMRVFRAYLEFCRGTSDLPAAQMILLSGYSALRVYRVRAYCQESCYDGTLVSQFNFDGFSKGKFTLETFPRDCGRVYNVSIDSLEYVNEQNIAVVVQVADRTYDPVARQGLNSSYVTYWLHPRTMQARTGSMWSTELPLSMKSESCNLRDTMPQVGTLGAELAVSGVHLLNVLVGAVLYTPGLIAMWKGGGVCPLFARSHSVLASCGDSVYKLDDFFSSLDMATAVFWGIPMWVSDQLDEGRLSEYTTIDEFLRGLSVYKGGTVDITQVRSGTVSLFDVPLADQAKGIWGLVRNPGASVGSVDVLASGTAWGRYWSAFVSENSVEMTKEILANGNLDLDDLWHNLLSTTYELRPLYQEVVVKRSERACMGLELLMGGSNPWGRLLYFACQSSARFAGGIMDLFLLLFVDAPIVKCVCKDSAGHSVAEYARSNCMQRAPISLRPVLLGMIEASALSEDGDALLCTTVISYTRSTLESTMRPYFSGLSKMMDALGESMDYMLIGFDSDAGQCMNFKQDPQVVVIMPEPVDYFQACAATTSCHAKCAGTWEAFTAERAKRDEESLVGSREIQQNVESLFFPANEKDIVAPGNIMALTELETCGSNVCRGEDEGCMAAAWIGDAFLGVTFYCLPSQPSVSAYATENSSLNWGSPTGLNAVQVAFLERDGSVLGAIVGSTVIVLGRNRPDKVVLDISSVLSLELMELFPMRIVDFFPVGKRLLVNVAVRLLKNDAFDRDVSTVWVDPEHGVEKWPMVVLPSMKDIWRGYAAAEDPDAPMNTPTFLLWPTTLSGVPYRLRLRVTNVSVALLEWNPYTQSKSLVARATLNPRRLVLSKTLKKFEGYIGILAHAGSTYDWLQMLRLSGDGLKLTGSNLVNSQAVSSKVRITTQCDGMDCRGCPDLALRSFCSSYQSCAVFRCVGTPVNLKRPLCGVGMTLSSMGRVGMETVQGGWVIFVDVYMILLQLSVQRNLPGVDVNFPDDAFLGNICAIKDISAEFLSILASAVNSVLQRTQVLHPVITGASHLDSNANTILSTSIASMTGFLHQIALGYVYMLVVARKIMVCQISGFLAVSAKNGFDLNIHPAKFASVDAIGGACLSQGLEIITQETSEASTALKMTRMLQRFLSKSAASKISEPMMHTVDGILAYIMGITAKFADLLQTLDLRQCMLPDVTLGSAVRCACGDTALFIHPRRRWEGLREYGLWCTGTLSLVDSGNRMRIVWNPYSYGELVEIIGTRLDDYVNIAGYESTSVPPNEPVFERQGISIFAVLARCRQNYVNEQWDSAAYARYSGDVLHRELTGNLQVEPGDSSDGVGSCLLESEARGAGNGECMDAFLKSRGHTSAYWSYVPANETTASATDACLVFSGPATNYSVNASRREVFRDCLSGYGADGRCDLSGFVWSPSSSNDVPVAVRHVVTSTQGAVLDHVDQRMRAASELVLRHLNDLLDFDNTELEAMVFSAEGDVIHQLLDCVFMGPYARMDYWPMPRCNESETPDCLVGPYWSRDENRGVTRNVDVNACPAEGHLPFTCGSASRRAAVRDFVQRYLQAGDGGADLLRGLIRAWLSDQLQVWSNVSAFGCDCTRGGNDVSCCTKDARSHLPGFLAALPLQIPTRDIMNALERRVADFYRESKVNPELWVTHLDTAEMSKYDWASSAGGHRVENDARFTTTNPAMTYTREEAMNPPKDVGSAGLWRVCHGALKQVMFTMPTLPSGELRETVPVFGGGGPAAIEEHVASLVRAAYESGPLYRHYHVRHHPTRSRMCKSSDTSVIGGYVRVSDYSADGNLIFDGASVPPLRVFGFDSFLLGAWNGTEPPVGLNEHLGFLDRKGTEDWLHGIRDLNTSAEYLLRYGPGGLKAGNMPGSSRSDLGLGPEYSVDLDAVMKKKLKPEFRSVSPDRAVLHGCDFNQELNASELVDFVEQLFPASQGITESTVGAYCMRYAIEYARLRAMELFMTSDLAQMAQQKEKLGVWRRRCGSQVQLVGMCTALDVYRPAGVQTGGCMHPWRVSLDASVEMYVTPECLVKIGQYFYDPCECNPTWCENREGVVVITRNEIENSDCALRFDPRSVVRSSEIGWWAADDPDPTAKASNDWLAEPWNLLDFSIFQDRVLGEGRSVGNVPPGGHWATEEGFLNTSGHFCDMFADYWPEEATFPVGYHVTTPSFVDEAGYRTFDNVFAEDVDDNGNVYMVYMEDQTRDVDLVDSHFGASGICRLTNMGFDMYETNTMRVCTKILDDESVDVHVPGVPSNKGEIGLARCSVSSTELPWANGDFYDFHDSALYSVGTVPNLPLESDVAYPASPDRYMKIGPHHDMEKEGWGPRCQDFDIPDCSKNACPKNFRCGKGGVCQHETVQCTQHADCSDGRMCSGMGTCEVPRISVDNQMGEDISVRAHTAECAGEAFSMRGASYWGYLPDFLEAHGMCSYRQWREYLHTMSMCCSGRTREGVCNVNGTVCSVYKFDRNQLANVWWNSSSDVPVRMKMIPTTCDRDYERFTLAGREMKSCVPSTGRGWLLGLDNVYKVHDARDEMWKTYDETTKTAPLLVMPFQSSPAYGFLGFSSQPDLRSCTSIKQCFVDRFTKSGWESMKTVNGIIQANRTLIGGSVYVPDHTFQCGVIGYLDSASKMCLIDKKLFPLYYLLCFDGKTQALCLSSLKVTQSDLELMCSRVVDPYPPSYSIIKDVNVPALSAFFNVFRKSTSLMQHLSAVECVNHLYASISGNPFESRGLYVPFPFTVYEIPFPWFYQCVIGSGVTVPVDTNRLLLPCPFYVKHNTIGGYVPESDGRFSEFSSYIFNVRGGYNRTYLQSQVDTQLAKAKARWAEAVDQVNALLYSSSDKSAPMCYTEKRWSLPTADYNKMRLIETYERPSCSENIRVTYMQRYKIESIKPHVTISNLLNELTVDSGNLVAQNTQTQKLLTGKILEFGNSVLESKSSLSKLLTSETPIRYDWSVPESSSDEFGAAKNLWLSSGLYYPNTQDLYDPVPLLCPSGKVNIYADINGVVLDALDTDRLDGLSSSVQTCSTYTTGTFGCRYVPVSIGGEMIGPTGNDTAVRDKTSKFVDGLHDLVKQHYNRLMQSESMPPFMLQLLPFYEEEYTLGFGNFTFDLSGVAKYINNIDPDVNTPVMCVAANQQIDYSNCTDGNFLALKKHVRSNMVKKSGILVPDRTQMDWDVDAGMMSSGAIYSFSAVQRDVRKQFLGSLFDEQSVCIASRLSHNQRLCSFSSSGVFARARSVSPWMNGKWNPYDQCDVKQMGPEDGNTETIDVLCYYNSVCPSDKPLDKTVSYYGEMPYNDRCLNRQDEKTNHINVDSKSPYNLCRHSLQEDSICQHNQGMLGGTDGMPSEEKIVNGNLYSLHEFDKFPSGDRTVFKNILLSGKTSDYGFLRVPLEHIGGHHIGMRAVNRTMLVNRMPLKPVPGMSRMSSWDSKDVNEWVPEWSVQLETDEDAYVRSIHDVSFMVGDDERGKPRMGWDCPLRRRGFYSGDVSGFEPMLPSARRSKRIFENMTMGRYAHPTQKRMDGSAQFGRYKSTNGFCFCPLSEEVYPGMCSVRNAIREEHNCSLFSTVQAVRGQSWGWSHTFKPRNSQNEYKTCEMQLDWPFVKGKLRDGATVTDDDIGRGSWDKASDVEAKRCHVLDRIPDFSYIYVSKRELRPSGYNTLDRGVCHTGRAQRRLNLQGRCLRTSKASAWVSLRCSDNQTAQARRKKSMRPEEATARMRMFRRYCRNSSSFPTFKTRHGHPLRAESSFGAPYRISAERALAKDLRRALCKNKTMCKGILNESAWTRGNFMRYYMKDPAGLFMPGVISQIHSDANELVKRKDKPDDSALWERPWVYCSSAESLRTGKGCNGSIPKAAWRQDKVGMCYRTIQESLGGNHDAFAKTDVCNVDGKIAELCKAIREAQSLVASANCLASGSEACALQEYVYSPGTWETTNQAFVHQTVREYYQRIDGCVDTSNCICGYDSELAKFRATNEYPLSQCSAVPVMVFYEMLKELRSLLDTICRILILVTRMVVNIFMMIVPALHETAKNNMIQDWAELKQQFMSGADSVADIFFDLAFSNGMLGPWMKRIITQSCGLVNDVYEFFSNFWCGFVVQQLPAFLGALKAISGWTETGFSVVNDVFSVILHDVLPDAMLELSEMGYQEFFQSTRYMQKMSAYESRKQANLGKSEQERPLTPQERLEKGQRPNPLMKNLIDAETKNEQAAAKQSSGTITRAGKVLGPIGVVLEIVNFGMTLNEMYEQEAKARLIAEKLKTFPKTFTLFDWDIIYTSIDSLATYLNADFTCYSTFSNVNPPLRCDALELPKPDSNSIGTMSPRASTCWADAQQQQIGVSTIYACTATSTCCADPLNCADSTETRMCADCPIPPAGVRAFGCNTMIQRCQCGLESYDVDRCVSQRECGPAASCSLLTALDDYSFGSLRKCTDCPSSPVCLISNSQRYGQCTCMSSANAKVDLCDDRVGAAVSTNPMRLCGYAKDGGTYFAWEELSLVLCVNAQNPLCAEVVNERGDTIYMPVASSLRPLQVSYGTRRLLASDDDYVRIPSAFSQDDPVDEISPSVVHRAITQLEWNHTAAPCSTLAHAYNTGGVLGPVDDAALHKCVYWRLVGGQIMRRFNLSELEGHDTFLLSPDDLSAALGKRGVLPQILSKPQVVFSTLLYSPWLKPIRAALATAHNLNVTKRIREMARMFRSSHVKRAHRKIGMGIYKALQRVNETNNVHKSRKLMGMYEDTIANVVSMPYYPYVRKSVSNISTSLLQNHKLLNYVLRVWSNDAFSWHVPGVKDVCPPATAASSSSVHSLTVIRNYYENFLRVNEQRVVSNKFKDVLPNVKAPVNFTLNTPSVSNLGAGRAILEFVLGSIGYSMEDIVFFMTSPCTNNDCTESNRWTFSFIIESLTFCELESVMYCNNHRRDLVTSSVVVAIILILSYTVLNYTGLGWAGSALFLFFPFMVLWYSIGVSPRCFPLVPTCLFDDTIRAVKNVFPVDMNIPDKIRYDNSSQRLVQCSKLSFETWEDPLVFAFCDMGFCDGLTDISIFGIARFRFQQKNEMALSGHADAYRICTSVTMVYAVPIIFMALSILFILLSLVISMLNVMAPYVFFMWNVTVYNHANDYEDIKDN